MMEEHMGIEYNQQTTCGHHHRMDRLTFTLHNAIGILQIKTHTRRGLRQDRICSRVTIKILKDWIYIVCTSID